MTDQPQRKSIRYEPEPTCYDFHGSNAFVRGLMGPYGSGKSVACCWEIFEMAQRQAPDQAGIRKTRWAIVRNSYGELRTTTQKTWTDWFPESHFGPIRRGSGPDTHNLSLPMKDGTTMELEVLFLAMDREEDTRKLLSLEITGCWLNEAREIRWGIVEAAMARVGRYPSKKDGGPSWHGIIMDTNPPNTRHWWFQRFEVEKPKNWAIFKQPSGLSDKAENIKNLPHNYYQNMMAGMDELSIKCHVHGEYALLRSGTPVFPQFQHSLHVAKDHLTVLPNLPVIVGIDVGRSPGAVFMQEHYGGRIHVLSEITGTDIPATYLAEQMKQHVQQHYPLNNIEYYADPAFTQRSQTRDESVSDIFFNAGLLVYPASTNSVDVRLESVRTLLQKLDPTGKPMVLFDPACEVLIEAMVGGYNYKEQAIGGDRFKEVPEKNQFSHIADALQYGILGLGADARYSDGVQDFKPPQVKGLSTGQSFYGRRA